MKLFIAACLLAVSLAQTEAKTSSKLEILKSRRRRLSDENAINRWGKRRGIELTNDRRQIQEVADCPFDCTTSDPSWVGDGICDDPYCSGCVSFWQDGSLGNGEFDGGDCENIAGCPDYCVADWIGDNICDSPDCSNCASFWSDNIVGSGTFDDGDCVGTTVIPDDPDCPSQCINDWIGDGICDETDCSLCAIFTDGNGVFDGGDCEVTTTTQDPAEINHNSIVIPGVTTCVDAVGICASTTFQAVVAEFDLGGNDYGCLDNLVRLPSWFLFKIGEAGHLRIDLLGDDDIDFIVWGPYDTGDVAVNACGTLGANAACSNSGDSREFLELLNVEADKYYILMVSDYAGLDSGNPTKVTIEARDDSTATLDCDIVVVGEQGICNSRPTVIANFANAQVERANLGSKNDPLGTAGTYYTGLGTYDGEDISLLVTTPDPTQYECVQRPRNQCGSVLENGLGKINMKAGVVEVNFEFRIDDGSPEGLPLLPNEKFELVKLTVLDIDSGFAAGEAVTFMNPKRVFVGGGVNTHLAATFDASQYQYDSEGGFYERTVDESAGATFTVVQQYTPGVQNPTSDDLQNLSLLQQRCTVQIEFEDVTSDGFNIEFTVNKRHTTGRNIWFAGQSATIGHQCCRDVIFCQYGYNDNNLPCGGSVEQACTEDFCCKDPPTSHGDPIIWTFDRECYDLNQDGIYVASKHPAHDHVVHIAVYNDYMREIQVTDLQGNIMLSVNNLGEVINDDWPYLFGDKMVPCPEDYEGHDCVGEYRVVYFDAQDLRYLVHVGLRHAYLDPALKEGEMGYHLDIYPEAFHKRFKKRKDEYDGLYFRNPLPDVLPTCADLD